MTVHLTIEIDEADEAQLRTLAEFEALSVEEAVKRIVSERLGYEAWLHRAVAEGRACVDRGDVLDDEEVFSRLYQRIAQSTASAAE